MQQKRAESNSFWGLHGTGRYSSDGLTSHLALLDASHGHGNPGVTGQRAPMESGAREWPPEATIGQDDFVDGSNNRLVDWIHRAQEEHLCTALPLTTDNVQELRDSIILESRASTTRFADQNLHYKSAVPMLMDNLLVQRSSLGNVSEATSPCQVPPVVSRNYSHLLNVHQQTPTHPNLFVRGFPLYWTENDLGACFQAFGTLTSVRIVCHSLTKTSLGYGFVRLRTPFESLHAIRALDGVKLEGNCLQVKSADSDAGPPKQGKPLRQTPSTRCYVKHIPTCFDSSHLRGLFEFFGEVKEIKIFPCFDRYKGSSGIVQMGSLEDASKAIATLNGLKPPGSVCELVVRYAESKEEKDLRIGITLLRK
eukprot:jgi/Picsp_1/2142/NSC_05607-R1_elav (embryonic abnormal drosophila)-like 2 (hu antigen b)